MRGGERIVCETADELAARAAARLAAIVATDSHRPFCVALAGGSTPRRLYERLTLPWAEVELFFGDERAVPPDHPDSNWGMVKAALLDRSGVRAHRMRAEAGAAGEYESVLKSRVRQDRGWPRFDLVILGVGTDGHTASLFPGTAALAEARRWVVMNDVPQLGARRMTLTFPVLNAARRIWILCSGADKRPVVEQLAAGARLPVSRIDPDGELCWWLDRAAAG